MSQKLKKVVLLGGSLGSLAPVQAIIAALGAPLEFSVIVVQHLDPTSHSHLAELLRRQTSVPCEVIENGVDLQVNRIYVAAPGDFLSCEQGRLLLSNAASPRPASDAIDRLAMSMAADPTLDPALVILSGTGSDGAEGAAAIRDVGGLVIAQLPEEARAAEMPSAVIDENLSNFVLSSDDIAPRLLAFGSRGAAEEGVSGVRPPAVNAADLQRVTHLLKEAVGNDFSNYRSGTLWRRLQRRMAMHDASSVDDYLSLFESDIAELQHLSDDFLIGVTSFFRDAEAFEALKNHALPALIEHLDSADEFRAWVVGCSTGEEVYSLAILVYECLQASGEQRNVRIFATDADSAALDIARAGVYGRAAIKALPEHLRARYFDRVEHSYVVKKDLREMVVFAEHNVITDTPFSRLDLIVCRNLLIYLNDRIKVALLRLFHNALRRNGVLFLGRSESVGRAERHFIPISGKWRIYRHNEEAPRRKPTVPLFGSASDLRRAAPGPEEDVVSLLRTENLLRRLLDENGPTQFLVDEADRLVYARGDTRAYLRVPAGGPSDDLFALIVQPLRASVRALLNRVRQERAAYESRVYLPDAIGDAGVVTLNVSAVREPGFENYLVIAASRSAGSRADVDSDAESGDRWLLESLRQEVDATREDMQQTIRRARSSDQVLRRANEEISAMNEELQSSNEELEASKEEMHSLNEDLANTNALLEKQLGETEKARSDLENVFNSSDSAMLILDQHRRIKSFTDNLVSLMRVRESDIDRDVADITRLFEDPEFLADIELAMSADCRVEARVAAGDGRSIIRRVLPYQQQGGRISGALINFIDVSELQSTLERERALAMELSRQSELLEDAAPIFVRDASGRIMLWNRAAEKLWGFSRDEALGANAHQLLKTTFPIALEHAQRSLIADGHWRGFVEQTTKAGRAIELSVSWKMAATKAGAEMVISEVYQDLSATMRLKSELTQERELFHLLLDWTTNAEYWTDPQGRITYMTPAIEDICGYAAQDFVDDARLLDRLIDESARGEWDRHVSSAQSPATDQWKTLALPLRCKPGGLVWVEHRFRVMYTSDAEVLGYRGSIRNIDEVRRLELEARQLAYNDPLTGLPNRRLLAEKLEEARVAGNRSQQYSALAMIDLDQFKRVNDTEGHAVGDELLQEVAARLKRRLRAFDKVSRLGGDEFMLILHGLGTSSAEAALVANRICEKVRQDLDLPYKLVSSSVEQRVTASIGVAVFRGIEKSSETLFSQADMALYNAKDLGRNRISIFDPVMQAAIDKRMLLERELRDALLNDGLVLHYQLQTDSDEKPVAAEALIRWRKPSGELSLPAEFLSVMEDEPLVRDIGRWVLKHGLQQLKQWASDPVTASLTLSVNVSAGYLLSDQFSEDVLELLRDVGVDPRRLAVEITENSLLADSERAQLVVRKLSDMGVRVSLDDFGTGYSSLLHLTQMEIGELKIDRHFVANALNDPSCQAVVESVIAISRSLSHLVVAEGVETREQLEYLKALGCDRYQGFLLGRPVPVEAFETAMTHWEASNTSRS